MSSLFGTSEPKPRSYADRARDGLASLGQKASDAQFEAEGLLGLRPKTYLPTSALRGLRPRYLPTYLLGYT